MAHNNPRRGGPVIRVEELASSPVTEVDVAAAEITPAIDALRAVGTDLDQENLDAAWIGLDNAELELRCQESHSMTPQPALGKALGAVERARESMAVAEITQAAADIDRAILVLTRA